MVAPRRTKKIFCTVVRVPVAEETTMNTPQRFSTRPSDLIPWADPYIAELVTKLQHEVRSERINMSDTRSSRGVLSADLEPPSPATETEWEWQDTPRWTLSEEV